MTKKAIVVLSGGLDSSTCAYIAQKDDGYNVHALSFYYGQRHKVELESAKKIARVLGIEHTILELPKPMNNALTEDIDVPFDRTLENMSKEIPITYVPCRNTVFIALALQLAEQIDAEAIYTGINAIDYSSYPDTRPEYAEAWQKLINLATKKTIEGGKIVLKNPLQHLYKAEIIEWGTKLGLDYGLTHSCYKGSVPPCLECDSDQLRIKGFIEAGLRDPLIDEKIWNKIQKIDNRYRVL